MGRPPYHSCAQHYPWAQTTGAPSWPGWIRKPHSGLSFDLLLPWVGSMESQAIIRSLPPLPDYALDLVFSALSSFPSPFPQTAPRVCAQLSPRHGRGGALCRDNRWSLDRTGVPTCAHVERLQCGGKPGRELLKKRS